jgi:large subunit ribosomal protein L25
MLHIAVTAEARPERLTKSARKNLRRQGRVLASVYGKGQDSTSVLLSASDISRIFSAETGENTLVDLSITNRPGRQLARVIAIEMEPITNRFRHVGLHIISANEPQKAHVPVEFVGEPEAVHNNVGILEVGTSSVEISALPEDLIGHLSIDVSGMQINDVKHVSDLVLPGRVQLITDPTTPLVSLRTARVVDSTTDASADSPVVTGVTNDSSSPEEAQTGV